MEMSDWYRVRFTDTGIHWNVSPPDGEAWQAHVPWTDVVRVCFKAGDGFFLPDEWYFFTPHRPESYVVPSEADGADRLPDELFTRGLFDPTLAAEAMCGFDEVFCWPPLEDE